MAVQEKLWTLEEFWEQYTGQPYELVEGRVVSVAPSGVTHGGVTRRIGAILGAYVDEHHLGEVVGAETGFWLGPKTLRGADCAFINREKMQSLKEPNKFAPFPPDLAVEVVSPGDTASAVREKVDQYRTAGTRIVWVIYPELHKVDVYAHDGTVHEVGAGGSLDGGDVLPGLQFPVDRLFPTE